MSPRPPLPTEAAEAPATSAAAFADRVLLRCQVAVCVGCGGVGKTTVAAALALEAARRGRRVLVLTIDPARRLADALGVEALGNEAQSMPRSVLDGMGVPAEGSLDALMLDMKRTFDDLVTRFAENEEARERILENPLYQNVSNTLAGSVEYSAMEKVYEMWESGRYDLIVVDTPPAQHALDFLEAPQRLIEFLESRLVAMLIHPAFAAGRFGFRIFQQGARRVLKVMERVSGLSFLEDVSEFLLAFEGMSAGFRERAGKVRSLLLGSDSAFLLVTGPARESVRQAVDFRARLDAYGVSLEGVLVNRMRAWEGPTPEPAALETPAPEDLEALAEALARHGGPGLDAPAAARAAVTAAKGYADLVRRDARATKQLRDEVMHSQRFWAEIPELPDDVHDLEGLQRIAAAVFAGEQP